MNENKINSNTTSVDNDNNGIDFKKMKLFYCPKGDEKQSFWQMFVKNKINILMIFIAATVFNFGVVILLNESHTIPNGMMGFPIIADMLLSKVKPHLLLPYLGLLYWIINVPFFIIFWKKIKKSFIFFTMLFMCFQSLVNPFFAWKPINDFFHSVIVIEKDWKTTPNHSEWPIYIYGIFGSILVAVGIGISWKYGGSTGGTDFIVYYFSTKAKKDISIIMRIVSFTLLFIFLNSSYFIQNYYFLPNKGIPYYEKDLIKWDTSGCSYISSSALTTIIYVLILTTVVDWIYPKYKKVRLQIYTDNQKNIIEYFEHINYWHAYTITEAIGGYTKTKKYIITTVVLLLEAKHLVKDIKMISSNLWFSISSIRNTEGLFNTNK
uniref:YitT family protein n=1 Tax=Mycoplasma elephantis TaxID=114882 RepID=UPI00048667E8